MDKINNPTLTMRNSTPVKRIENMLLSSKISVTTNPHASKEITSQQLKSEYLQTKLLHKTKKLQSYHERNQQLLDKMATLQHKISAKQLQICAKDSVIETLNQKVSKLQSQVARLVQQLSKWKKQASQQQVQQIKQKQQQEYEQKLNKMLTKQNRQLIAERLQYKKVIEQQEASIGQVHRVLALEKQNNQLVTKFNEELKLQVEELLFQLRMLNRREQANQLYNYEHSIDTRYITIYNKSKVNKAKTAKQNIDINMHENYLQLETEDRNHSGQLSMQNQQLVELLKQKIIYLEQSLSLSERRCKQLQDIILTK